MYSIFKIFCGINIKKHYSKAKKEAEQKRSASNFQTVATNQMLIVMSTPAGRLSFLSSSTVLTVGSMMSIKRL